MQDRTRLRYADAAGAAYHRLKHGVGDDGYGLIARLRAQKLASLVAVTDVVLEYGVGTGWNLAELRCRERYGHDVAETVAPLLESRGIHYCPDTTILPDGICDVVLCHHCLEHLIAPASALAEMRRLLKVGGRLLLFVPFEKEHKYRRYNPEDSDCHVYSWNPQSLGNLVGELGFAVTEARLGPFGYEPFLARHTARFGNAAFRLGLALARSVRPVREVRLVAERLP